MQQRETLRIDSSQDPTELDMHRVTLEFDEPKSYENESQYGENEMYMAYTWAVQYNGEGRILRGTSGLYNAIQATGAKTGTVLDLYALGEQKEKRHYAKYISGPVASADQPTHAPTPQAARPAHATPGDWSELAEPSGEETSAKMFLALNQIDLVGFCLGIVNENELFGGIGDAEKLHIAMSGAAYANRMYRNGMVPPGFAEGTSGIAASAEMQMLDKLELGTVGAFAKSLIALPLGLSVSGIKEVLGAFDIKSGALHAEMADDNTTSTLKVIRTLGKFKELTDAGHSTGESLEQCAGEFGWPWEPEPADSDEFDDIPF